ncbi:hypothetical protein [Pseudanabaena sp. FACHB-2040]|uniref:hypothetical protein n=1 Tax=Pseudanabaena sp. FACHB-2040 TaxID=2692859 RepID=UPI001687CD24|nr:hypothetical protein [Pseudanabaena sp. FACHB-2040]MBD2258331.1 hypothetical protein [Pseudanabaena sp. FACHB-2040]
MRLVQLELPLWQVLETAAQAPAEADMIALLDLLEETLSALDALGRLQVVSEGIAQIVQVFEMRSQIAFEDLEATASDEGPPMPANAFDQYVRQTMELDFEPFIAAPEDLPKASSHGRDDGALTTSVAGELDRAALLQVLETQMSQEPALTEADIFNRTLSLAHEEDVSTWVAEITRWMSQNACTEITLIQLQQLTGMPLIQLWLALLLGGYPIEQRGDFYDISSVWVNRLPDNNSAVHPQESL